jgi:hypothetical protein
MVDGLAARLDSAGIPVTKKKRKEFVEASAVALACCRASIGYASAVRDEDNSPFRTRNIPD